MGTLIISTHTKRGVSLDLVCGNDTLTQGMSRILLCVSTSHKNQRNVDFWTVRWLVDSFNRGGSRGRVQGVRTPPEMTCGFLINTVQSASQLYKICFIIWYVFSAVHIMLLPSRKPSSSYSLLKFVYVTSQLRHSLVVHPLLRKILDPPLLNLLILCWIDLSRNV